MTPTGVGTAAIQARHERVVTLETELAGSRLGRAFVGTGLVVDAVMMSALTAGIERVRVDDEFMANSAN